MEESLISDLLKAAREREKQGEDEEAERLYRRILEINPFQEAGAGSLISLYLRNGKRQKARQFKRQLEQLL